MPTISIAVIAHNEERNIARALSSAAWADEVILVDCGSTDGTVKAAAGFRVKLFSRPNSTAVYVNKQFAIDQAASDWIFILDADEEIPAGLGCRNGQAWMNLRGGHRSTQRLGHDEAMGEHIPAVAGIVRQRPEFRQHGQRNRLLDGIGLKSPAVLDDFRKSLNFMGAGNFHAGQVENGADFRELVRIAAGNQ